MYWRDVHVANHSWWSCNFYCADLETGIFQNGNRLTSCFIIQCIKKYNACIYRTANMLCRKCVIVKHMHSKPIQYVDPVRKCVIVKHMHSKPIQYVDPVRKCVIVKHMHSKPIQYVDPIRKCVIVRRAGLLWSQQDFEWLWSVPLSSASLY